MVLKLRQIIILFGMVLWSLNLMAAEYNLVVQPTLSRAAVIEQYKPLADYLSAQTGHTIKIKAYRNFLTYWEKMKKSRGFDLVLDAAHFTDFRVQQQGYKVLAKIPDTVSFAVVTTENKFVFDTEELVLKKVASMSSPGLGGIRLGGMFPNPIRLPFVIPATDSIDAVEKLLAGNVDAAIIPTPLVGNFEGLNTITTTESVPHMALSSSPEIPDAVAEKISSALVNANMTESGQKMLSKLNLVEFVSATNDTYAGYAELLDGVFGYMRISKANNIEESR